jgi:hypothetical protein
LDGISGVAASRVDWTGTRFLITLGSGADRGRAAESAAAILGEGARILDDADVRSVLDSYEKGETWMRAGETLQLSRFEAGVLARRYGKEAGAEIGLDDATTAKLVVVFEQELDRAFDRVHAGKGIEELPQELAAAAGRILESTAGFLDAERQNALADYLKRFGDPRVR